MIKNGGGLALLRLIGWNGAVLAALILVCEIVFGYWFWGDPLDGLNIFRGVTWRYDANHLYARDEPVIYRRDKWGFRGQYGEPADIGVLIVGGSTTDQRFITEGETWPDVFSQCLDKNGVSLPVANGGVTGQSTQGFLADMDLWFSRIPNLKPKFMMAYLGINDIWAKSETHKYKNNPREFNEQRVVTSQWSVLYQRMKMHSAMYRLYRTVKGAWIAWKAGLAYQTGGAGDERAADVMARKMTAARAVTILRDGPKLRAMEKQVEANYGGELVYYRRNLLTFVEKVRATGTEPLLVTQTWANFGFDGDRLYGDAFQYALQNTFNDVTRQTCAAENLPCIDLAADISFRPGDTIDAVPPTPRWAVRVGDYICKKFLALIK